MKTPDLKNVLGLKKLDVFMNETQVGTLALTKDHVVAFQYCKGWLDGGFSVSPLSLKFDGSVQIPKFQPFEGLFGVFDDCLPDGWGRLLTDRMLKKHGIDIYSLTSMDRLALVQKNSIGALNFKPNYANEDVEELENFDEIAKECQQIFDDIEVSDIDQYYKMGGSSGGARPKVNALIDGEHWIVKFGSSMDVKNIGEVEYNYNELAVKCGIDVAEHMLIDSNICSGIFASKRFDYRKRSGEKFEGARTSAKGGANTDSINAMSNGTKNGAKRNIGVNIKKDAGSTTKNDVASNAKIGAGRDMKTCAKKLHVVSAGGLLEVSHRVPALDYDHLLKLTLRLTKSMAEVEKMFLLMVFNVAIGNKDDHAKNFSFFYEESEQSWHLCPAYDLTKNDGMAGEHTTTVNGKGKDITKQDMLETAKRIGISTSRSKTLIEQVYDEVELKKTVKIL